MNRYYCSWLLVFFLVIALLGNSFSYRWSSVIRRKNVITRNMFYHDETNTDPNFEYHLPNLLRAGSKDRPNPDLPKELRSKYYVKKSQTRLSAMNSEIAEEVQETEERFKRAALNFKETNRPDPDLPSELRAAAKKSEKR